MKPFSVIIITFNEAEYLPVLLASVRQQSVQPEEIIVADANSQDGTTEIAHKMGAMVTPGGLPSVGRNKGATVAKTERLLFLDADVQLKDTDFFKKAWEEFEERDLDVATADAVPIAGKKFDQVSHRAYNRYVRLLGAKHPHLPGFCIFAKKHLHEQVGGFDEEIMFCEDHEYAGRCVKRGARYAILNSVKIPVSVRRMERDGRFTISLKYLLGELHYLFIGPVRDNSFRYTFGYGKYKKHDEE